MPAKKKLGEMSYATEFKKAVSAIVDDEVDRIRPRYRYGTVVTIDRANRKCEVQFTGESGTQWVGMHVLQPAWTGQYVQVAGMPSDFYVSYVFDAFGGAQLAYLSIKPWSDGTGGVIFLDPPPNSGHSSHGLYNSGGWFKIYAPGYDNASAAFWVYPAAGEFTTSFVYVNAKFKIGNENYYRSNRVQLATTSAQSITAGAEVDVIWHSMLTSVADDGVMWTSGTAVTLINDGSYMAHAHLTFAAMGTGQYLRAYIYAVIGGVAEVVGTPGVYFSSSFLQPAISVDASGFFPAGTKLVVMVRTTATVNLMANKAQTIEGFAGRTTFDVVQVRG